jgi:hypothetical protein
MQQQSVTLPRPAPAARLVEWKPWPFDSPSPIGHATIAFAGGWTVHRIPIFRGRDGAWSVGTPSAVELDGEGRAKTKPDGKRQYWPMITFETAEARGRWQLAILAALETGGIVAPNGGAP